MAGPAAEIVARTKQPYRAPIVNCLLAGASGELARELLTGGAVQRAALFDAGKVNKLLAKMQSVENPSEIDGVALAGILSSHIIHQQFVEGFAARPHPSRSYHRQACGHEDSGVGLDTHPQPAAKTRVSGGQVSGPRKRIC